MPTVSKRLGYTSTAVTLDVNGRCLPEQDRDPPTCSADCYAEFELLESPGSVVLDVCDGAREKIHRPAGNDWSHWRTCQPSPTESPSLAAW